MRYWTRLVCMTAVGAAVIGALCASPVHAALINTYPSPIVVTASSTYTSSFAGGQLVNGSGLSGTAPAFADADSDGVPEHSNGVTGLHWLSQKTTVANQWVAFDLGQAYDLASMRVWNYNQSSWQLRSVQTARIYYSTAANPDEAAPGTWTQLVGAGAGGVFTFAQATGQPNYDSVTDVSFGGASVRHVLIDIQSSYGTDADGVGLSEVQFFSVPEPATLATLALGALALLRRRRA